MWVLINLVTFISCQSSSRFAFKCESEGVYVLSTSVNILVYHQSCQDGNYPDVVWWMEWDLCNGTCSWCSDCGIVMSWQFCGWFSFSFSQHWGCQFLGFVFMPESLTDFSSMPLVLGLINLWVPGLPWVPSFWGLFLWILSHWPACTCAFTQWGL